MTPGLAHGESQFYHFFHGWEQEYKFFPLLNQVEVEAPRESHTERGLWEGDTGV